MRKADNKMDTVKLGVIGIGNMGSGHCMTILRGNVPEITLTAVADIRESRREWAKENLPAEVQIFESAEALINSGACEAVLIAFGTGNARMSSMLLLISPVPFPMPADALCSNSGK